MRQPIPLTDEMIHEPVKLRKEGMGLRPLARHFGISHQTIRNWLDSRRNASKYSESTGFAIGDRATLRRKIASGPYQLKAGEVVVIETSIRQQTSPG